MSKKRKRATGRGGSVSFIAIPHAVLHSPKYRGLSPKAVKLLLDLFVQYKGYNNGDFSMPWSRMADCGWNSKQTLTNARNELIKAGFVLVARQGGKHACSLYAVTWLAIDDCDGKLDICPTRIAPGYWKS